jgi:hypothetical protein
MRAVSFRYRPGFGDSRRRLGVVAEELVQITPEPVFDDGKAPPSVDYDQVVPVLIRALQDLADQLDATRDEVRSLQAPARA